VSGEFFAGLNDCGEFTRGQTYRLAPVALEGCDLPEPFRFRFGFGLEKLPAWIKRTKIEISGMRLAVAIFEDSKSWSLHGRKYSRKRVENVNIKSMTVAGGRSFVSIFIGKRLGSSVGRAVD